MHKAFALLLLLSGSLALAQQGQSPSSNAPIFNYPLEPATSSKQALNMEFLRLENFKKSTWPFSQSLREASSNHKKQPSNMPIFAPEGTFFLERFEPDENIDYKLRIFDLE